MSARTSRFSVRRMFRKAVCVCVRGFISRNRRTCSKMARKPVRICKLRAPATCQVLRICLLARTVSASLKRPWLAPAMNRVPLYWAKPAECMG